VRQVAPGRKRITRVDFRAMTIYTAADGRASSNILRRDHEPSRKQ
jgi:hypothetical protein